MKSKKFIFIFFYLIFVLFSSLLLGEDNSFSLDYVDKLDLLENNTENGMVKVDEDAEKESFENDEDFVAKLLDTLNNNNVSKDYIFKVVEYVDHLVKAKDNVVNEKIEKFILDVERLKEENLVLSTKLEEYINEDISNDNYLKVKSFTFAGTTFDLNNPRLYDKFMKIFKQELKYADNYISRSGYYFPVIEKIFERYNIPDDIKYLAVAESYLNPMANSPANAVGIWQFISSTAKYYKLTINDFIDERRDIFKSTTAAAKHLADNKKILEKYNIDDWLLTMCSYNAGVNRVIKDVNEQGGKKFFDLILRIDETNNYVWRAAAIKMIFENQNKIFGKKLETQASIYKQTRATKVTLRGYYQIDNWAKAQGTVISKVWEYNPWIKIYKRRVGKYSKVNNVVLPPGTFYILLPKESKPQKNFLANANEKLLEKNYGFYKVYRVRKGDTLYSIAKKHNSSVYKIKSLNNLRTSRIYVGQRLKLMIGSRSYTSN